jgi:NADH-quinone oxidoreductase subunit N
LPRELLDSLAGVLPEGALTVGLLLVVLVDAFRPPGRDALCRLIAVASLAAAIALALLAPPVAGPIFSGMLVVDPASTFFKVLLATAGLLVACTFTFRNSRELTGLGQGEFYALLLGITLSSLLLATANDLAMLYLALEMVSIGSYVMVAYMKGDTQSNEASLKYLLFGAVSTGAMLYGLSLLYGLTGTTSLPEVRSALSGGGVPAGAQGALWVITLLVFAGFGFKIAAVPFHFWCPDVYQGAPTPVTAFLSVAPKAAGFAIALRFFFGGFATAGPEPWDLAHTVDWPRLLMVLSAATMTVGNVAALTQTNMKRLLAYSSIAHAGYVMMGLVALSESGARGVLVYLLAYLFMNLGAFLVVTLVHHHDGSFDLRDWPGLSRRAPGLAAAMAVFMLSLMGIPPLVGFMGKLYVFAAVIERGGSAYTWLAVVGALNAAIAAFYYARVMKTMIIDAGGDEKAPIRLAPADAAWVTALAVANVVPLLFWSQIEGWTQASLVLWAAAR